MLRYICSKSYWQAILLLVQTSIARANKNTFLGWVWALIQPFVHIAVISYVFSFLLRQEPKMMVTNLVGGLPIWTFIMNGMTSAANSLVSRSEILKRIVIAKTFFPVSEVLSQLYTLAYSFLAMYGLLILLYPELFSWQIIFLPVVLLPLILSVIAGGIVVAYLTPYVRDVPNCIAVLLGVVYWTVPIIYPYSIVPQSKQIFFEMNPVFILIRPGQYLIVNGNIPDLMLIIKSWITCFLVVMVSFFIYKKLSRNVIYYL
jgi:lipopolysaccharide transport system permease protein